MRRRCRGRDDRDLGAPDGEGVADPHRGGLLDGLVVQEGAAGGAEVDHHELARAGRDLGVHGRDRAVPGEGDVGVLGIPADPQRAAVERVTARRPAGLPDDELERRAQDLRPRLVLGEQHDRVGMDGEGVTGPQGAAALDPPVADPGAAAGAQVAEHHLAVVGRHLGVRAGDVRVGEHQVDVATPDDGRAPEGDLPSLVRAVDHAQEIGRRHPRVRSAHRVLFPRGDRDHAGSRRQTPQPTRQITRPVPST